MENKKLKACLKEIEGILEKYEAGGFIAFADKEGGEFKFVNPAWSAIKASPNTDELRQAWLQHKANNPDRTAQTIHLLQVIQDAAGKAFLFSDSFIEQAKNHFEITGGPVQL